MSNINQGGVLWSLFVVRKTQRNSDTIIPQMHINLKYDGHLVAQQVVRNR